MNDTNEYNKQKEIEKQKIEIKKIETRGDIKSYMKDISVQLVSGTILFVVGLVLIMSFARPVFKNSFDLTSFSILLALAIYGTVAGRAEGMQWFVKKAHGLYMFTYNEYLKVVDDIKPFKLFLDQWLDILFEKKRKQKMYYALSLHNISDVRVLDLDLSELNELKHIYRKDWLHDPKYGPSRHAKQYAKGDVEGEPYVSYFNSYTDEQIEVIRAILTGTIKVDKLTETYFLSPSVGKKGDAYYNAPGEKKEENTVSVWLILSRIALFVLSAILLSNLGFEIYEIASGDDGVAVIVQRLIDCCSRIFTLFSSVVWGFSVGGKVIDVRQFYLNYRKIVLEDYRDEYNTKVFVPVNINMERKNAYEEEQKVIKEHEKKVEEDNKNIEIMPEKADSHPIGIEQKPVINMGGVNNNDIKQ